MTRIYQLDKDGQERLFYQDKSNRILIRMITPSDSLEITEKMRKQYDKDRYYIEIAKIIDFMKKFDPEDPDEDIIFILETKTKKALGLLRMKFEEVAVCKIELWKSVDQEYQMPKIQEAIKNLCSIMNLREPIFD